MTLASFVSRVSYAGAGSAGPFAFPFRILAAADLRVIKRSGGIDTVLNNGTDYAVSGVGNASGSVVLTTALATGETLVLRRAPALTQPVSIRNQGPYFPATHEDEFDRLVMQMQDLEDQLSRSVKLAESFDPGLYNLQIPAGVGGSVLGFNTAGDALQFAPPAGYAFLAQSLIVANVKDPAFAGGALGNGVANDTAAFNAARAALVAGGGGVLWVPAGTFILDSVAFQSNIELAAAGRGVTIFKTNSITGPSGILSANSGGSAAWITKLNWHDFTIDGQVGTKGWSQFEHLISWNGVKDSSLERVEILGPRGDGWYIGSGVNPGDERHNLNLSARDVTIDGVVKDQRNGISFIDCDGFSGYNVNITRIGNGTLSRSVGPIDFEPNDTFNVIRNIRFFGGSIKDCDSVNTAAITLFTALSTGTNIQNFLFDGMTFERCYREFVASSDSTYVHNVTFRNCHSLNPKLENMLCAGIRKMVIDNYTAVLDPPASANYRGGFQFGDRSGGAGTPARVATDITFTNNYLHGLRPQNAAVYLSSVDGLFETGNTFHDISGRCHTTATIANAGTGRLISGWTLQGNTAKNPSKLLGTPIVTSSFIDSAADWNTGNDMSFINTTCSERNNKLIGVSRNPGGMPLVFKDQILTGAPAAGTWTKGDETLETTPAAGSRSKNCSVTGTLGVLAGATGDATNGTAVLLNVADPNNSLRKGQYILVTGDAVVKQIISIVGTTVYLLTNYTGVTTPGAVLTWVPATAFVAT